MNASRPSAEPTFLLALLGAGLLFLGAFSPIFSVPVVGSHTFMQNGSAEGVTVIACAAAAAFLALTRKYELLLIPGVAALILIAFSYISFRSELGDAGDDIPFTEIRKVALGSVQLQWGWAVLVLGALLVCGAGVLARRPRAKSP
jgi:hypothetical protein